MFGDPIRNPMNWKKIPLGECCDVITGNTPPRANLSYYGNFIEWIKSDNISANTHILSHATESLSEDGAKVGRIVGPGSILMTCIAGGINSIGNVSVTDRSVAYNQQINAMIPHQLDVWFLYNLLIMIRPQLHESTNRALKCILTKRALAKIAVIVPPLPHQKQFAAFVRQTDKSKLSLKNTIHTIEGGAKDV